MLWPDPDWQEDGIEGGASCLTVRVIAMSGMTRMMDCRAGSLGTGIHPSAVIDPDSTAGRRCRIP